MSTRLALVDCNNFFCSCERVFDPSLQNAPIVVLSNNDGCIISRSEEAKALGIPMGAPLHEQQELIRKHGVRVFSSNYTLYGDMSARVMSILRNEVSFIEVYSIDEAFLELAENFTEEMARALRAKVLRWTGLPVCIGIASTKLLAKAANHHAKKHKTVTGGVFEITGHEDEILTSMATSDLWGVGRNLSRRLQNLGIHTALDLKQADPTLIRSSLGVIGERILRELNRIPCLSLEEMPPARQGVMASRSFGTPVENPEELQEALANHVARASERIRRFSLLATRMEVFLQTNRFRKDALQYNPSLSITLDRPTSSTAEIMTSARKLLECIYKPGYHYKKTGIQLLNLVSEEEHQLELFASPFPRKDIDSIVDRINNRLGDRYSPIITRASQGTFCSAKGWQMRSQRHSPHYTTSWQELPIAKA